MDNHAEKLCAVDPLPRNAYEESTNEFWSSIQPDVEMALREYVKERYPTYNQKEQEERYHAALLGEESLVKDTLLQAERLFAGRKDATAFGRILFDIDDTLGKVQFAKEEGGADRFLFRPSAPLLLKYLKERFPFCAIGFLSTRGKEKGMLQQLREESLLGPVACYVDEREVYSTRDAPDIPQMSVEGEFEYLTHHPDVNPATLNPKNFSGLMPGEISKLEILRQLHEREPDIPTVVVDDFSYPQYLKNGVRAKIF